MSKTRTDIIVKLEQKTHANLDSFPFRYGFYSQTDIEIQLTNISTIDDERVDKPNERYAISATFKLPNSKVLLRGKFIIAKRDKSIITVIRKGFKFNTEYYLSETLRKLREDGEISPHDLIDMHKEGINTHAQVVSHLSKKIGEKKVIEAQNFANEKIAKMSKALQILAAENKKKDDDNEYLSRVAIAAELEKEEAEEETEAGKREITELKKKLKTSDVRNVANQLKFNELIENSDTSKNLSTNGKVNYSAPDWGSESSTSGVFKSYEVRGDYLVVILHSELPKPMFGEIFADLMDRKKREAQNPTLTREIKCKNTHIGDYQKAVNDVKKLVDGDMIVYSTRGSGIFGSEWFFKIGKDNKIEEPYQSTRTEEFGQSERADKYEKDSRGLNTDDSNWGYYDHDTDFDIDENGNIR